MPNYRPGQPSLAVATPPRHRNDSTTLYIWVQLRYTLDMSKTAPFSMRLEPELKARLKRLAKKENRTLTNYIETMLRELVERSAHAEKR